MAELTRGLKLAADGAYPGAIDLSSEMARLRANLLSEEDERYRALSKLCAEAMDAAIRAVRPGMTEYEIAALLDRETQARGVQPIVNLIATDERIFNFRHPLPIGKKLEKYAMLVLCGRKYGLVTSITRLVHFGRLPDELRPQDGRRRAHRCGVHRSHATGPHAERGFQARHGCISRMVGFPDEWQLASSRWAGRLRAARIRRHA